MADLCGIRLCDTETLDVNSFLFRVFILCGAGLYEEEKKRRIDYLDESTEEKLLRAIDEELVGAHQTKLLNNPASGYNTLLAR